MRWILILMLIASAQAQATLIQYTFHDLRIRPSQSPYQPSDQSDLVMVVDSETYSAISLTYNTIFFDINFRGLAEITSQFRGVNEDGSGYYAITSFFENTLPDGGGMHMYMEASIPLGGNPSFFLDAGTDGQFFTFYTNDGETTHHAEWMRTEKVIVPEPAPIALLGLSLLGMCWRRFTGSIP